MKIICPFIILLASSLVSSQNASTHSTQVKIVMIGDTVAMECFVPTLENQYTDVYFDLLFLSSIPGKREITIGSYKQNPNNVTVRENSYKSRIQFLSNGTVQITFIGLPDDGTYTCHPRAYKIPSGLEKATTITVYVLPEVKVKIVNISLVAGSPLTDAADCIAAGGKPPAQVHWTTDKQLNFSETVVSDNSSIQLFTVTSTLRIEPIKYYNNQRFSCVVKHPVFTSDNITNINLNVTYKPDTLEIIVDEKNNLLTCNADGNPPVTYTWLMPEGTPIMAMNGSTVDLVDPSHLVYSNDTYMCIVSNSVGESKIITTYVAFNHELAASQAGAALIVGGVIEGLVALAIIVFLVYFFMIMKRRDENNGKFQQPSTVYHNTDGYTRSNIQHKNENLNKQRRPSPVAPPPEVHDSHSPGSSDIDDHGDLDREDSSTLVDPVPQKPPKVG